MRLVSLGEDRLRSVFGIGVAGNFAGHLEQAGEDRDFVAVDAQPAAPKGIFPFFTPGRGGFLGEFPLSSDRIAWATSGDLQIEPELGVLFGIEYGEDGSVVRLVPEWVGAFNDCSMRRPDAAKISEKKNWGAASKGVAAQGFEVDELSAEGATATLRIACFMRRGIAVHEYGIDSAAVDYSYYGSQLLEWVVDRLGAQRDEQASPLEDVGAMLDECGRPPTALIGIGATRYTEFGETNFLQPGDESIVIAYDSRFVSGDAIRDAVESRTEAALASASILRQVVS